MDKKRELFEELLKGIEEMTAHREERFQSRNSAVDDSLDSEVSVWKYRADYLEKTDDQVP